MEPRYARQIEDWIEAQLAESWQEAELLGRELRSGVCYFQVASGPRDFWLIVGPRAYRGLSVKELSEFLRAEDWLERLRTERCLRVQLPGLQPELVRPPWILA